MTENKVLKLLVVEDNLRLQAALKAGLEATGVVHVVGCRARRGQRWSAAWQRARPAPSSWTWPWPAS